jgi:hypothetical protein
MIETNLEDSINKNIYKCEISFIFIDNINDNIDK